MGQFTWLAARADAVADEEGKGQPELVAVEGAGRLSDDDRGEAAAGVAKVGEQPQRLGRPPPPPPESVLSSLQDNLLSDWGGTTVGSRPEET